MTAEANTSEASAIPTASYAVNPQKVISMGVITTAADKPASPVPIPAPSPAIMQTIINTILISLLFKLCYFCCFAEALFQCTLICITVRIKNKSAVILCRPTAYRIPLTITSKKSMSRNTFNMVLTHLVRLYDPLPMPAHHARFKIL